MAFISLEVYSKSDVLHGNVTRIFDTLDIVRLITESNDKCTLYVREDNDGSNGFKPAVITKYVVSNTLANVVALAGSDIIRVATLTIDGRANVGYVGVPTNLIAGTIFPLGAASEFYCKEGGRFDLTHVTSSQSISELSVLLADSDTCCRLIAVDTTQTGNVGAGEDTLQSYSIAANTLSSNKDTISGTFSGTVSSSVNTKRLKLKFGATTIFDSATIGAGFAASWVLEYKIIRTGASSQKCHCTYDGGSSTLGTLSSYTTASESLSGAVNLVLTGEAIDNNDIVKETFDLEFKPAP